MTRTTLRRHARGTTLIEGMVAAGVLVIGLLGTLQALVFASRQNADADKRTRAASVGIHLKSAVEGYGWTRLAGAGGPFAACSTDADLLALVAHLPPPSTTLVRCVVDLDAFELSATATTRVMHGYRQMDRQAFRRILVAYQAPGLGNQNSPERAYREVAVVVSWRTGLGNRSHVTSMVGLYDPRPTSGNETNVEI
jgi:hypothetical protein